MLSKEMQETVDEIIQRHHCNQAMLITVMQEIQKVYHYLPEDVLIYLAGKMDISQSKVFGVATFYENFSLSPKGKYVIKICDGTACHVRKSIPILEAIRRDLGLSVEKHTTDDMLFTVETVSCLGACGLAPVMTINEKVHPKMTPDAAIALLLDIKEAETNENS